MPEPRTPLPPRRAELVIRPLGDGGQYVVKDPRSGEFFHLGLEEHFLLTQLDGEQDVAAVCSAFERRFSAPLTDDELDGFVTTAREQGLLEDDVRRGSPDPAEVATEGLNRRSGRPAVDRRARSGDPRTTRKSKQSILYWRKRIFDPDRLFNWLEPKVRFFWTAGFLVLSAGSIVSATFILWTNGHELAGSVQYALRWETVVWAWLVMLAVTTLHEFAHGLTCKHYGGEVREIGFLLMFFMPCFYCNVSDAWLFREKSKRLWVTFAGGYFELFLWALAVFVWRLTLPGSFPHYLAFLIVASSGIDTLFNFNPLIKLDGYYLLSDWVEVPNLQQRATGYFKGHLRRWLWGAGRPDSDPRGRLLLGYGVVSWLYSLMFLFFMLWGMFWFFGNQWGVIGMNAVMVLGLVSARGLLKDTSSGEVRKMLTKRQKRLAVWLLLLVGLAAVLTLVKIDDRAGGKFVVRPTVRTELRAPVAGFLKELYFDEGERISSGSLVARLDIPDLASRRAQKQAEVSEASARLRLLEAGARPEEMEQQRQRVVRAKVWRDLAQQDLQKMRQALVEDLVRIDTQIAACQAELDVVKDKYKRAGTLVSRRVLAEAEYHEVEGKHRVCQARLDQARAEKRARQANGTLEPETELARRQKELADVQAALELLKAGTRPETIEAERARLARLEEELRYLQDLARRLPVATPAPGVITTARLKERIGQYLREGELICVVEEPCGMEVEISLSEQDVARIELNQLARIKVRALPFETFQTKVDRIAPAAGKDDVQNTVIVYCHLDNLAAQLRPGMTGYARIYTGRRCVGTVLLDRILRFVRTEFWW